MNSNMILERLEGVKHRFEEVGQLITDPDVIGDMNRYVKLNKEYKELEPIIETYNEYKNMLDNIQSAKEILDQEKDPELREMAKAELEELNEKRPEMEGHIKFLLVPKDPEDDKNAVLEIRAGTGGDEASIFAGDLYRMYTKYCETKGWKIEVTSYTEGTVGGYKEIIMNVTGDKVYGTLKYESGVHRVQRVPQTETQGRVHTSAATVAVLP
ncbi:MAG: PCRF domain-containing protein, partial [Bacteroidota bacterium]